ncbi:MAG: GNAT family N-acetyltransferase [Trebonia sp.]
MRERADRAFAVIPSAQGHGVGRKLLAAVIERAEQRGVRRLRRHTNSHCRIRSRSGCPDYLPETRAYGFRPTPP